ncbi:hypothetical protein QLS71_007900 [Mariniflexile litorale]|uniref:HMG-CoA reductase N-terminal domain-containing protein n=1 Tax=Mariniflexile litorale TaxID=3045158 RepID=A0AAU7EJW2_9FLAO|nr:hypothetical protein [Mariniflexile sp. KMM 9835]MDQ8213255.1 hypothetical protein [Mariniflexile sp. KMM 9835]
MKENMPSLKNFKNLKASSITESVIAISIISICALVAFTIYLNVIKQNKSIHYYNAKHTINFLIEESVQQNDYEDNSYSYNEYTIDKKVGVNKRNHTALLTFTFKSGNKTNVITKLISYNEY